MASGVGESSQVLIRPQPAQTQARTDGWVAARLLAGPQGQQPASPGATSVSPGRPVSPAASDMLSLTSRAGGTPLERALLKLNKATRKLEGENIVKFS